MHEGLQAHLQQNPRTLLRWFWLCLVLTIATLLFSEPFAALAGLTLAKFAFSQYISALTASLLLFSAGLAVLTGAFGELKAKRPSNLTLATLALLTLFGFSAASTISKMAGATGIGVDFWWQISAILSLLVFGRWLEVKAVHSADSAMPDLLALLPKEAELSLGNDVKKVGLEQLSIGDIVVVHPDAVVPADGVVIQGRSSVDEAAITGQSGQVAKVEGDRVFAGSTNSTSAKRGMGALTVRVTAVGSAVLAAGIMRFVEDSKANRFKSQRLAARFSSWIFYLTLIISIGTASFWLLSAQSDVAFAVERATSVLLISAPVAMALAVPLIMVSTTFAAARSGLLVLHDFDLATQVKSVVLNKTGVLTTGRLQLQEISLSAGSSLSDIDELLQLAAAAEAKSDHQLAAAIGEAARLKNLALSRADDFAAIGGVGVQARIDGRQVSVGGPALLNRLGVPMTYAELLAAAEANENGFTVVFVVVDAVLCGQIQLKDEINDGAADAVRVLASRGIDVSMVTGDATGVANFVARQVGIERVFAEVQPLRKVGIIKELQAFGTKVAFVGNGSDDAEALAQSDLGFAFGAGGDIALQSAGLILINSDPSALTRAFLLAKKSLSKRRQNLIWCVTFGVASLAIAAGASASAGLVVSPVVSAVLVSLSTVIVAANGQLLRR